MSELPTNNDGGAEKRRSARLLHAVPIIVTGTDALGQSFRETTSTVMVSCTGCKYKSTHYVPKNSRLTVEINRAGPPKSRRILRARVVWVQRPSNYRDHFHIAVEFDVPGNVWGIASPPENWFAHPEDVELEIPVATPAEQTVSSAASVGGSYSGSFTASVETIERPDTGGLNAGSQPHMTSVTTMVPPRPASENGEKSARVAAAKEAAAASANLDAEVYTVVKEILEKELGIIRAHIESEIRDAITSALKTSMEKETASALEKILEQSKASAAALVEQAQKVTREFSAQFDEKFRLALDAASSLKTEPAAATKPRVARKSTKRKAKIETSQEQ